MLSICKKKMNLSSSSHLSIFNFKNETFYRLLHLFSSSFSSSSSSTPTQTPHCDSDSNFMMRDYLIEVCGFSPQKAATASKRLAKINSPEKPDSARHFFKHHVGFTDPQIRTIISSFPRILAADVCLTLRPYFDALQSVGFSEQQLQKIIICNPSILRNPSAIPRLEFWKIFMNGDLKNTFLAFTRNGSLVTRDTDNSTIPKISLLRHYGLSDADIRLLVVKCPRLILRSTTSIEELLKHAKEFGFQLGTPMFVEGLSVLNRLGIELFMAKMIFFKSFGWSREDFLTALRKCPHFAALAEEKLREKMGFLVGTIGCTHHYIVSRPAILGYSLERRMMPRHHAMEILISTGLIRSRWDFYSIVCKSEKKFMDNIILPYKDKVPTLLENYTAACAGEILP